MGQLATLCLLLMLTFDGIYSEEVVMKSQDIEVENVERGRDGKLLPIFQVVRFPNDVCTGTSRNGTCYTAEECSSRGGSSEGTCASGFGVCCIISLTCGGSTSDNNSYIVQASTTSLTSPCTYSVCPCSNDICRIRYDFTTHVLAEKVLGTAKATGDTVAREHSIGDCVTDSFNIASPGKIGSPIICGYNSGQHMIIDVGEGCQSVNFKIGPSTSTTRQWHIYVSQYTCGQEDLAGAPGCLQYHTGTTGLMKNFGFPSSNTGTAAMDASTTHLQNQVYQICIRRESGYCYICYASWYSITAAGSFGLSTPVADAANAAQSTACIADYVVIPGGTSSTIAAITTPGATVDAKFCGRQLSIAVGTAPASVCSRVTPFRFGVVFNDDEGNSCVIADVAKAEACETDTVPGGIAGFAIGYTQVAC